MNDYTGAEKEALFQIDEKRYLVRRAHEARMRLSTRQLRETAKLSDFLENHDVTWCWFIHNNVGVPICAGWPTEPVHEPTHYWESRRVWNDCLVYEWTPIPEIKSPTAYALTSYLKEIYGRDPELELVGWDADMVQDFTGRFQYRCVVCPELKIPTRNELINLVQQYFSHN